MTGYGFYSTDKKNYSIEIETKALNSKYFDFNLKSNHEISGIENEIRNFVKTKMFRGKIEVNITVNYPENKSKILDKKKYLSFFNEIKSIAKDNKVEDTTVHNNIFKNLSYIENDNKLNILLDRIDNGEKLGEGLTDYVNEKLNRADELIKILEENK